VGERQQVVAALRRGARPGEPLGHPEVRAALGTLARVDLVPTLPGNPARVVVGDGVELALAAPAASAPRDPAVRAREIEGARANIARLEQRLANADFVDKAKPEIVQAARDQLQAAHERLTALEEADG
jgi:valyl-tRNA synthetase